jgi:putative PIN family toxin of toxin-antitoxin system
VLKPLVVIDANVVASALLGRPEASSARLLRLAATGDLTLALSDEYLLELERIMDYPELLRVPTGRAFTMGLDLGLHGDLFRPDRLDWPSMKDRKDWYVLDLAFDSGADYLVTRDRGFDAVLDYFEVLTPPQLLAILA